MDTRDRLKQVVRLSHKARDEAKSFLPIEADDDDKFTRHYLNCNAVAINIEALIDDLITYLKE